MNFTAHDRAKGPHVQASPFQKQIIALFIIIGLFPACSTFQSSSYKPTGKINSGGSTKEISKKYLESDKKNYGEARAYPPRFDSVPLFDWPVEDARLSRGFMPNGTRKRKKPHLGIDLAAPKGTAILAAQSGTVIYAGKEFKGYGKLIMIENGNGWATLYAHLDKILVSEGQKVRQGEVIAAMGNTGRSTGNHLHFEIRREQGPIDPMPFLPASQQLLNRSLSSASDVTDFDEEHEE